MNSIRLSPSPQISDTSDTSSEYLLKYMLRGLKIKNGKLMPVIAGQREAGLFSPDQLRGFKLALPTGV